MRCLAPVFWFKYIFYFWLWGVPVAIRISCEKQTSPSYRLITNVYFVISFQATAVIIAKVTQGALFWKTSMIWKNILVQASLRQNYTLRLSRLLVRLWFLLLVGVIKLFTSFPLLSACWSLSSLRSLFSSLLVLQ